MKISRTHIGLSAAAVSLLILCGCATTDEYRDDQEYSDNMPWNTPQQWEGSQSIPGMSPSGY